MSERKLLTQNPIHIRHLNNQLDLQRYKLSMISFNKRPLSSTYKKSLQTLKLNKSKSSSSILDRSIRQENMRLAYKIMQISKRKFKQKNNFIVINHKYNPQRQRSRDIILENQRLGKSLVRIKTGKSIERVKTEIIQKNIKKKVGSVHNNNMEGKTNNKNLFKDENKFNKPPSKINISKNKMSHIFINFPQSTSFKTKSSKISQFINSRSKLTTK